MRSYFYVWYVWYVWIPLPLDLCSGLIQFFFPLLRKSARLPNRSTVNFEHVFADCLKSPWKFSSCILRIHVREGNETKATYVRYFLD